MAFTGTKGGGGNVRVFGYTESTQVVGTMEIEFTLIGGSGPSEQDSGLFDIELKHIQLNEAFDLWADDAAPYDETAAAAASSGAEVYDLEDDESDESGTTSTSPTKYVVYTGPKDTDSNKRQTIVLLAKLARGSRNYQGAKKKFNELTTKLVGVAPTGDVTVTAAHYPASKVTGASGTLLQSGGRLVKWLAAAS